MKSIARREAQVISEIRSRDMVVFTHQDVHRFLDISKENTYRIIGNMIEKGLVKRIERGKFILTEVWNELDIYEIAAEIFQPSYIAFWSALHYHDMTDQVPRVVFLVTTKRKKPLKFQGQKIKYVTVKGSMFFGYERYGKVLVSDMEKTVIDCLRHPEYSGGISQIQDALSDQLNTDRLIEYCKLAGSSAVASRLGYLLEKRGIKFEKDELKELIDTYTKLDPNQESSVLNSEWKLYVKGELR
ncbi:MAG: type IV toxin-antitoxin system AbiEi family antitoxin domain-containing protein [Candidatus Saliniplasma sp.]